MRPVLNQSQFVSLFGRGKYALSCAIMSFLLVILLSHGALANAKYASLVIDADTGVVLHQENAGLKRYPASLTKMMTLYLTFQALERGKLSLNQSIVASSRAEKQPPSELGLRKGDRIKVKSAIEALVVKSANDVAVALAEAIGGTEWQFAMMMNRMAKRLGMNQTNFRNASGLHHSKQYSNAYDMARLAVALRRDYPQYYHFFKRTTFRYGGHTYKTHNRVTQKYPGADGIKTGYINASGFNLVTSVNRSGQRVVGVVLGGRSSRTRDSHMMSLLNRAYKKLASNRTSGARIQVAATPIPKPKPGGSYAVASIADEKAMLMASNIEKVSGQGDYDSSEAPEPESKPNIVVQHVPVSQHYRHRLSRSSGAPIPQVKP